MTLKQVVLPAPLGPIRPRISPVLMWNETPSRAVTPPKRSVTSSTSSILPGGRSATSSTLMSTEVSGSASVSGSSTTSSSTRAPRPSSGEGAVGSSRVDPVDPPGSVSGMCRSFLENLCFLIRTLGPQRASRRHEPLGAEDRQGHQGEAEEQVAGVRQEPELLRCPRQQCGRDDDTPAVALAADDDHGDEEDGVEDGEVVRVDELLLRGE